MQPKGPATRVLIAGGGVASLEAALALRELAVGLVEVEVVAPDSDFTYRPLAVAEPFLAADVKRFPLATLVERAGARLRPGIVTEIDVARKNVLVRAGEHVAELSYDMTILALGARADAAVPNALTFRGPRDIPAFRALLDDIVHGAVRRVVFALPAAVAWPLPLYELALMTANYASDEHTGNLEVSVVTPEPAPLAVFGSKASDAIRELLEIRGVKLYTQTTPLGFVGRKLSVAPRGTLEADRVVALPRLRGAAPAGVPQDQGGFIPTDEHAHVQGLESQVFAAGDVTQFPIKQGGIAAQQGDAAAEAIAAAAGAEIDPVPFRPVLRGLLLTGMFPRYLRSEVGKASSSVDVTPLWWPPAKIVGKHLAPFLAEQLGITDDPPPAAREEAVAVEVEFDAATSAVVAE